MNDGGVFNALIFFVGVLILIAIVSFIAYLMGKFDE